MAESSDGRVGDCRSKGPPFKPGHGLSLRIGNNTTLQLLQQWIVTQVNKGSVEDILDI